MSIKKKITIKELAILTVVIFCIIIAIFYTLSFSNKSYKLKQYVAKLEQIQQKVNYVRDQYKVWNDYNPNEYGNFYSYLQEFKFSNANSNSNLYKKDFENVLKELENGEKNDWNSNIDSILTNYYYFTPSSLKKYFGLDNINYYVIINFYTGNVVERDGIYDIGNNKTIYRQYDSSIGNPLYISKIYNDKTEAKIEVVENRGLSQKIKIYIDSENKNDLPDIYDVFYYTETDETLKSCSYLDDYTYIKSERAVYFTVSTSNKYFFVVEDSNYIQYEKIEYEFNFCNPPILGNDMEGIYWDNEGKEIYIDDIYSPNWYNYSKEQMKFANAKSNDGNYWVWIPRYSYKIDKNNDVDIEFVDNLSSLSTSKRALVDYKIQKAFSEEGEITGFWVSKFQANVDGNKINIKPGLTLTYKRMDNDIKDKIMSESQREAILLFAEQNKIEISNDHVHYAGGSPDAKEFIHNEKYSNTNNVYGVYDLICSENELTRDSNLNEEGRFRLVIK